MAEVMTPYDGGRLAAWDLVANPYRSANVNEGLVQVPPYIDDRAPIDVQSQPARDDAPLATFASAPEPEVDILTRSIRPEVETRRGSEERSEVITIEGVSISTTTEPVLKDIAGQVYVQADMEGLASYHFEDSAAFISYEAAPPSWTTDDGSAFPAKKYFATVSYDRETRTFVGEVDWTPTSVQGARRWIYEMVFDEQFTEIAGGQILAYPSAGDSSFTASACFGVGKDVVYTRSRAAAPKESSGATVARQVPDTQSTQSSSESCSPVARFDVAARGQRGYITKDDFFAMFVGLEQERTQELARARRQQAQQVQELAVAPQVALSSVASAKCIMPPPQPQEQQQPVVCASQPPQTYAVPLARSASAGPSFYTPPAVSSVEIAASFVPPVPPVAGPPTVVAAAASPSWSTVCVPPPGGSVSTVVAPQAPLQQYTAPSPASSHSAAPGTTQRAASPSASFIPPFVQQAIPAAGALPAERPYSGVITPRASHQRVAITPGDQVVLVGLKSSTEFNGRRARVVDVDQHSRIVEIRMDDGSVHTVRSDNMQLVTASVAAPAHMRRAQTVSFPTIAGHSGPATSYQPPPVAVAASPAASYTPPETLQATSGSGAAQASAPMALSRSASTFAQATSGSGAAQASAPMVLSRSASTFAQAQTMPLLWRGQSTPSAPMPLLPPSQSTFALSHTAHAPPNPMSAPSPAVTSREVMLPMGAACRPDADSSPKKSRGDSDSSPKKSRADSDSSPKRSRGESDSSPKGKKGGSPRKERQSEDDKKKKKKPDWKEEEKCNQM